ncbi:hypothetical protein ACVWXL_007188 [Bradyrhizobium sp. GM22.5]
MSATARSRRHLVGERGETGLNVAQQRLDEERVVIGRAVADLHRLPHRFGNPSPGRIDDCARRRSRDEDTGEVEQQRGVLVAARVETRERHGQLAAAEIGIADQVERGVGRQKAIFAVRAQQMLRAVADHAVDLRLLRHGAGEHGRRRLGMIQRDAVDEIGDGLADRCPIGLGLVAGAHQGLAQPGQFAFVAQLGQPGPAEQYPQCGIAERGLVELGQMRIAAGRNRQYWIADVVKRGAVLPRRQRPAGGAGKILKAHEITWSRELAGGPAGALPAARHPLQVVEKATRIRRKYKCDEGHRKSRHEACIIRVRKATGTQKNHTLGSTN